MSSKRIRTEQLLTAVLLVAAAMSAACNWLNNAPNPGQSPDPGTAQPGNMLPFGNPSKANSADKDNYLLAHDSHVLSYNNARGTLNWAAWRTTRADVGDSIPRPQFEPDQDLPEGFRRIAYYDYSGSGYDRGHIVPSADRFGNAKLHDQIFLMTNIVPQTSDLNRYPWNKLEMYARSLVFHGSDVYTIAGVYGEKGRLKNKVTIPTNCWKVIVIFARSEDPNAIGPNTRIIAVDMPNENGIRDARWESYKTTVRSIEQKTGYDLFSSLPRDLQDRIETRID